MSAEMITAIGAIIVGVAAVLNAILSNRKSALQINNRLDGVDSRLEGVERRLDSHNHYAEMFADSSQRIARMETDLTWIKNMMSKGDGK